MLFRETATAAAAIATAVALGFPTVTPAVTVPDSAVQIQVDIPGLIQWVKTADPKQIQSTINQISPYIKLSQLPNAKWEFVRDAIAGDILISINGETADVSVASDQGILDVELHVLDTDVSFTIANDYLPKIPLAEKRTIRSGVVLEPARVIPRTAVAAQTQQPSIWDRTDFDLWHKGWTNRAILGSASLGLGSAYAGSYAYYTAENERAEAEAEQKKRAAIAKRKEAAAKAPPKPPVNSKTKKKAKVDSSAPAPVKEPAKARSVKKPVRAMRVEDSVPSAPKESKYVVPQDD